MNDPNLSADDKANLARLATARNAAKTGPVKAGQALPVFTQSSVETAPVKADPNAPDFRPQGPPELLPGGIGTAEPPEVRPGMPEKQRQAAEQGQQLYGRTMDAAEYAQQVHELEQAHPTYQKAAGPLSDITGRVASAAAQANVFPSGGEIPGERAVRALTGPTTVEAQRAGRQLFPQTPEEAGFDTAIALVTAGEMGMAERTAVRALKAAGMTDDMAEMLGGQWIDNAMRMKRAGAPIRMATTGLGRGLGSVAGGGPFWGPAAKGATYGGMGELGSGAIGLGSRWVGEDWLINRTVSDLGNVLSDKDIVPELKGLPLDTPGGWEFTFKGDNSPAVQQVAGVMNQLDSTIEGRIQTLPFKTQKTFGFMVGPPGAKQFHSWDFAEANEEIDHLNDIGWSEATGAKRFGLSGKAARDASFELREQLADQLNRLFPKRPGDTAALGDQWLTLRRRYGLVKDISREITKHSQDIFRKPEEIQGKLQTLFGQGPVAASVVDMLGPQAGVDILSVIRRGEPGPAYDIPSQRMSVGARISPHGVHPHISPPRSYRAVGGVPMIMNPPAGPFSLAARRGRLAPWLLGERTPEFLSDQEQQ
jgi:hypothetical protein